MNELLLYQAPDIPSIKKISLIKNNFAKNIHYTLLYFQLLYKTADIFTFFYTICTHLKQEVDKSGNHKKYNIELICEFLDVVSSFEGMNNDSMQQVFQWFTHNPIEVTIENKEANGVKLITTRSSKGLDLLWL